MRRAAVIGALLCVVGVSLWVTRCTYAADGNVPSVGATIVYDVPRISHIAIDGKADDWGEQGFRINLLADLDGRLRARSDLDATCRLGWDERGLLILAEVSDDLAQEADTENYWDGDAVEVYFSRPGEKKDMFQVTATPGVDPKHTEPRVRVGDNRADTAPAIKPLVARTVRSGGGYTMEIVMPWAAFGVTAQNGQEYQLQVQVNDWDTAGSSGARSVWFPGGESWSDPAQAHRIRLAEAPSAPSNAVALGAWQGFRRLQVRVATVAQLVGKTLELRSGDRVLGSTTVSEYLGRGQAVLRAPLPPKGQPYGSMTVACDGQAIAVTQVEDIDQRRTSEALYADLRAEPFLMMSSKLPAIDFVNPERMEDVLGPYRIETTFYDADCNIVTSAQKPGRYGAVVRVVPEQGAAMTRFVTLFRSPTELRFATSDLSTAWKPPAGLGIDPAVVTEQADYLGRQTARAWFGRLYEDPAGAVILAGLHGAKSTGTPARLSDNPVTADRQWWANFKRKQYGFDQQFGSLPAIPSPIEAAPALVLREATAAEAGMRAETTERVDAVCQAWLKADPRPFVVALARHGVVFYHKPYGENRGRPTRVEDAFPLASISKLICGTQFMMLVDRGLISLDDPIEKYLPPIREVAASTGKRITFRHLFTHTAGLQGHWGEQVDLEYRIAELYPTLSVGQRHEYQGVGYELAGKVMELLSGKAMPVLSRQLLIEPLGLAHSDLLYMAAGCEMSALDLAKVGQMHLNNGAYGPWRFMSEQTMAALRPKLLTEVLGPKAEKVWGIGNEPFAQEGGANAPPQEKVPGLSATTYGHGSATGCIIRIDPEHQIVAVMVRPGTNWGDHEKWVSRFVSAIREGLDGTKTATAAAK